MKNVCKVLIVIALLLFSIYKVMNLLESKASIKKYNDFYTKETDYDVLFLGSSHMMNSLYPMELYEKYGIKSYNLANSAEAIPTSYWVLKNALNYRKPKIVILEVFFDGWGMKVKPDDVAFLHNFFDELPLSVDKIKAIYDIVGSDNMMEYLFNFSIYHSRWDKLEKGDFEYSISKTKGAEILTGYQKFDYILPDVDFVPERAMASDYINRMKKLCEENGIKLILFESPFCANEDEIYTNNFHKEFHKKIGLDFINLFGTDIIDYTTDMNDRGHLNIRGAKKITNYIGNYLSEEYSDIIGPHKDEKWDRDLLEYKKFKENIIFDLKKFDAFISTASEIDKYKYDIVFSDANIKNKYIDLISKTYFNNLEINVNASAEAPILIKIYDEDKLVKIIKYDKNENLVKE